MRGAKLLLFTLALLAPVGARTARAEVPSAQTANAGVVNITSASAEELMRLPGIGEKKAGAIIEHRRTHALKRFEDLTKVKGIGRKTVARLRPYLSLSGPTTLKDRPARPSK